MNFIISALTILYVSLAGHGFLRLLFKEENPFSLLGWIPLSFTAGFGLLGFLGNLIMLARWHLSFWLLALPFLPLFISGLLRIRFRVKVGDLREVFKKISLSKALFLLVILFGAGSVFLMSVAFPMHWWDSRAIWGMKAKMLFADGTIFSPNFLDPDRIQPHFRYLLLYPLAQAFIYFSVGQIDDWAVMVLVGLFFPFLIMFLYELLRIVTGDQEKALMGAAILAMLPVFYRTDGPAFSGYADTPLALFFLVSFGTLFLWRLIKDQRFLITGCILSAILPLVKNEGSILLLLNFVWIAWPDNFINWKDKIGKALKDVLIFLIIIVVVVGPWILLRSNIPNVQEEKYFEQLNFKVFIQNVYRIPAIFSFIIKAFLGIQPAMTGRYFVWGGLWIIFILASIRVFAERKKLEARLFWVIILFCFLVGGIYYFAPGEPKPADLVSNFFRITLSITPLVVLLVAMQCEKLNFPSTSGGKTKKEKRKSKGR